MRLLKQNYVIILITIVFQVPVFSQITITQAEFLDIFTPGNPLYAINGESGYINIGNYNGPNEYDFTFVNFQNPLTIQNYNVSEIPELAERYPAGAHTIGEGTQNIVQNPVFLTSSDSTYFAGETTIENEYRFVHYVPFELFAKFPLSFNPPATNFSQWLSVYDTSYSLSWQLQETNFYNDLVDVWIDGYGTLKLPGIEVECLRMKRAYSWFGYKEFIYLTKTGILVIVSDVTGTAPDTGFVNADYQVLYSDPALTLHDEENAPFEFLLEQNYPNPFNPVTIINYQITMNNFVRLKVYNALGEEVAILVNEEKPAGRYHVEMTGGHLPSGVYLYQLTAGKFSSTKKMIVIK